MNLSTRDLVVFLLAALTWDGSIALLEPAASAIHWAMRRFLAVFGLTTSGREEDAFGDDGIVLGCGGAWVGCGGAWAG